MHNKELLDHIASLVALLQQQEKLHSQQHQQQQQQQYQYQQQQFQNMQHISSVPQVSASLNTYYLVARRVHFTFLSAAFLLPSLAQ